MDTLKIETLVIGGGITGLLLARRLHDDGRAVVVLDKGRVLEYVCHRWGFARARTFWQEPCYWDATDQLLLAGDGFGGGRVEGAAVSALAGAAALTQRTS